MALLGKSIDLYLMDGTAAGRWQATLSNWNCFAYKIPRSELKNCDDLPDLRSPGVYFLFGLDDETGRKFVYVGEGDDVLKRILQPHSFERDGSYWTEAVILVTPDGSLDKAKIKYLENRFHRIVIETKRYLVKNGNTPTQSTVQKKIRDMLEEFIMNTRLIMPALGHKVFEPQPSEDRESASESGLLYFEHSKGKRGKNSKGELAIGKVADDGFWVLKGSHIHQSLSGTIPSGVKKGRDIYADFIDNHGVLQRDVCFGSPSYAASFVCGFSINGLTAWKSKEGLTLKELNGESEKPVKKSVKRRSRAKTADKEVKNASDNQEPEKLTGRSEDTITIGLDRALPQDVEILHIVARTIAATGYVNEKGFVVLKGSQISASLRKSCRKNISEKRTQLIETGKIKEGAFTENVQFSSPSTAASVIVGGEANGRIMWKNDKGKTLKKIQAE